MADPGAARLLVKIQQWRDDPRQGYDGAIELLCEAEDALAALASVDARCQQLEQQFADFREYAGEQLALWKADVVRAEAAEARCAELEFSQETDVERQTIRDTLLGLRDRAEAAEGKWVDAEARCRQLEQNAETWKVRADAFEREFIRVVGQANDAATRCRSLEDALRTEKEKTLARVEPLKAGVDGQDLPQSGNEPSPSLIADHIFVGGYAVDPTLPAICQVCNCHISEHLFQSVYPAAGRADPR